MVCTKCGAGVVALLGGAGAATKYLCDNGHSGLTVARHTVEGPSETWPKTPNKKEPLEPTSMERRLQREEIIQMMKELAE